MPCSYPSALRLAVPSMRDLPFIASLPIHRVASTRRKWPLEKTRTSPASTRTRLTTRSAIAEQLPVRAFLKDVNRQATFVFAVVPFDEIGINLSYRSEAGQLARPHDAPQGAGEYLRECQSSETLA